MRTGTRLLQLAGYLWAAPCSAVGLVVAACLLWRGGEWQLRDGVLEVPLRRAALFGRFGAITFGHVVIAADRRQLARLRRHELEHVRQYMRWGPLFFPAYAASSLLQWLRGRDPHRDNGFEVQARRRCGEE